MPLDYDAPPETTEQFNYHNARKDAMVLRALNHTLRQQIISVIDENKRITVTDLFKKLKLDQSVMSQHLAVLRRSGFVSTERDGKFIFYSINAPRIKFIQQCSNKLNTW